VAKREDGKKTRLRLLKAASEVFGQKGYRSAKVADICRRAGANVASVNYYFNDKASLYVETWRYVFQQTKALAFSAPGGGTPEKRFRAYLLHIMEQFAKEGMVGSFNRLYLMELLNPTGLIQDIWLELIKARRRVLQDLIREIMGDSANEERVLFCEMSVINQCRVLLTVRHRDLELKLGQPMGPELIQRMADHIADFSLAGIMAVGAAKA
jgi:TetR/AcrR family transcriptional regulator, regulator of cefoperazone and chloramphenicol sensitivity